MADGAQGNSARVSGDAYEGGSGSTVVLLHGLTATWRIWLPVLKLLEPHHRVVALTLPGHDGGPALPPGVEPTVESMADALVADLHARGIEQPHVVGNSLGGWLSLELARRGLVRSVTAFSPAGGWRTEQDYRAVARPFRIVFALIGLLMVLVSLFLGFAFIRRTLNAKAMDHGERMPPVEMRSALAALRRTRILPGLLRNMARTGPIRPFSAGKVLIRVAWCEHDQVIPFKTYGPPVLEAVDGAESLTVTGVGHVPMYDDPGQVADIILETTRRAEAVPA